MAVLLFGAASLFARWVNLPALCITFGRVLVSSITLWIYTGIRREKIRTDLKSARILVAAGVILALHWWTFLGTVRLSTVAVATITFSAFPMFTAFLEPLVRHTRISRRNLILAAVILVGIAVTIPWGSDSSGRVTGTGILCGLVSSFAYACLTIINSGLSEKHESTQISLYEQTSAAAVLLVPALLTGAEPSFRDVGLLVIMGAFTTALAHTLFIRCLRDIPAQTAGICSSMESVYSIVLAALLLGEMPSFREILGAAIIVGAVVIAQVKEGKVENRES